MKLYSYLRRIDWWLFIPAVLLWLTSYIILLSLAQGQGSFEYLANIPPKHLVFLLVSISAALFIVLTRLPLTQNPNLWLILWLGNIALLILALVSPPYAGTHRWIKLGPILIQPSEFYKFTGLLMLSYAIAYKRYKLIILWLIGVILIFMAPDLGMSLIHIATFFIIFAYYIASKSSIVKNTLTYLILIFSGILVLAGSKVLLAIYLVTFTIFYFIKEPKATLLGGVILGSFLAILSATPLLLKTPLLAEYQKKRLEPFIQNIQEQGPLGILNTQIEDFHARQSRIAIGSGGIWGKGLKQTTQTRLRFLPEAESDFIYATLSEMYGLVGSLVVLSLYTLIILRLIYILKEVSVLGIMEQLIIVGILSYFMLSILWSLGINLGILPTKGLVLPFLSYGGSSLLTHFLLLGLANRVYLQIKR